MMLLLCWFGKSLYGILHKTYESFPACPNNTSFSQRNKKSAVTIQCSSRFTKRLGNDIQSERPEKDIRLPKKEIWIMNLFLCSRFCNVGTLIKEDLQNKRIAFIPTAAAKEGASRYVLAGREVLSEMGAIVTKIDISKEDRNTIKAAFAQADCIYFSGGNSFFLMDALRKSGTDKLLKKELQRGKLMVGESAGAIVCAPTITYIEPMDKKPPEYSQQDDAGLGLVKYYILPHFLDEVYRKASEEILEKFSEFDVRPISNNQAILVKDNTSKIICNSDNEKAVRDFRNEQG